MLDLGPWSAAEQARCQRLYVEAAALGVLGAEPYAGVVAEANQVWLEALADHLVASGMPSPGPARAAVARRGGVHGAAARRTAGAVSVASWRPRLRWGSRSR